MKKIKKCSILVLCSVLILSHTVYASSEIPKTIETDSVDGILQTVDLAVEKPQLTEADKILLEQKGNNFTVLISEDSAPLEYIDDGNPSGILIDIMNMIAVDAGIEFNYVFETDPPTLDYDNVDISISLRDNTFINESNSETDPFFVSPMVLIGKMVFDMRDLDDDLAIGMIDYRDLTPPNPNVVRYDNIDDMISLINEDSLDFIIATTESARYILEQTDVEYYYVYNTGEYLHTHMTFPEDLSEYIPVFNKLIQRLDSEAVQDIVVNHSLLFSADKPFSEGIFESQYLIGMVVLIIALICVAFILKNNKSKKEALYKIINEDELTGLISDYRFHEMAKEILLTAKPNQYIIISIDIDNFSDINETQGYAVGSKVLTALASQLSSHYTADSLIAREKDDNFLILTLKKSPELTSCGAATCDDCISVCTKDFLGGNYKVGISRGIYEISDPSETLEYMIGCAHSARLSGKQNVANSYISFTEEMKLEKENKNKIISTMEQALINHEFKVFYQPKVDLADSSLSGAEALVRWFPADGGKIYPDNFISIFEKNGFILDLDYYVFEEVCMFISLWQDTLPLPLISVNLSGTTLLDEELVENLTNITAKYNLVNCRIGLEIAEGSVIENFDEAVIRVSELKNVGFTISLDDFGGGRSSFKRLKDLKINYLKIDRDFLASNLSDDRGIKIVKGIVMLLKDLNITAIAEGVETKEQVEALTKSKCIVAQGYYFGRPMPDTEFRDIVSHGIKKN